MPGKHPTWNEAVNEKGAVSMVIESAFIVFVVAVVILLVGWRLNKMRRRKPLTDKQTNISFLVVCGIILTIGLFTGLLILILPPVFVMAAVLLAFILPEPEHTEVFITEEVATVNRSLIYHGQDLEFPADVFTSIFEKRLPFFSRLHPLEKQTFISRTRDFIRSKKFIIHDQSGFREMPILISATAVQLSFGMRKYTLPYFSEIHVYPEEFLLTSPSLRFVMGNVCGTCINISWKHFLSGFEYPENGENVGLHEMSHAYHYQNITLGIDPDRNFRTNYPLFEGISRHELLPERKAMNKLYSAYGLSNEDEFFAETIELFFEKPFELKGSYPETYRLMCELLNQDPAVRKIAI